MKHVSEVLRELLRRLYMGRRTAAYWRALQQDQRRYYGVESKARRNDKR